ncbi:MAG TPA: hypothetical protein VIE43_26140 [Thermoanaerobaculia bacterium]|jgi:hypothetical protein|nr:hypothetical protein [Thermoanaerobaculia bacterium]
MLRRTASAILGLLVAVLAVPAARATTAVELTEADLVQDSTLIVTGHCTHLQSQWAGNILMTLATIQVTEVLKGNAGSPLTVALPGGADANRPIPVAMNYVGAPVIFQQEDVVLFLNAQNLVAGSFGIVGFSQGKFTLVQDARGKKVATQNLGDLNLQTSTGSLHRGTAKSIQLDELRQRIREANAQHPQ